MNRILSVEGGICDKQQAFTRKQSLSRKVTWRRASNMAVNLTDLSLPQLEGLKSQLDQVIAAH